MIYRVLVFLLAAFTLAACAQHSPDDAFVASANKLRPSVVLLTMDVPGEQKNNPDNEYATGTVVASGRWGSDILTVEHALEHAWNIRVTIANKDKTPGRILKKNADLDVALVRISRGYLAVSELGHSADAEPGRSIGLLGYPIPDQFDDEGLGLATSLNAGRISSLRDHALEVTMPIVPGESGSPVFLADTGEIVGIAESRFDQERSIGFALPIDDARKFLRGADSAHGL